MTNEPKTRKVTITINRDKRASLAHALDHLRANKIADSDYCGIWAWYSGNREQFIKRHKKAVALLTEILEQK